MASGNMKRTVEEAVERLKTSISPSASFIDFDLLNEKIDVGSDKSENILRIL